MSEAKPVTFRSKAERYQTYIGDRPANLETNMPAKAGKMISFFKFKYVTSDPKEIAFLRDQVAQNPGTLSEVKPEKKVRVVEIADDQTIVDALEKTLAAEKEVAQETPQEESTAKTKSVKK
ncbi:MAG: hypothetical protein KKB51_23700 [Candidatus Riflebacteria bacterium]|nr:hypothetical protein [Candidatus Riflebacteria bacterium]